MVDQSMQDKRLNDPKNGAFVIMLQRVHENDLTGHILLRTNMKTGITYARSQIRYETTIRHLSSLLWRLKIRRQGRWRVTSVKIALMRSNTKYTWSKSLGPYVSAGQSCSKDQCQKVVAY